MSASVEGPTAVAVNRVHFVRYSGSSYRCAAPRSSRISQCLPEARELLLCRLVYLLWAASQLPRRPPTATTRLIAATVLSPQLPDRQCARSQLRAHGPRWPQRFRSAASARTASSRCATPTSIERRRFTPPVLGRSTSPQVQQPKALGLCVVGLLLGFGVSETENLPGLSAERTTCARNGPSALNCSRSATALSARVEPCPPAVRSGPRMSGEPSCEPPNLGEHACLLACVARQPPPDRRLHPASRRFCRGRSAVHGEGVRSF